MDEMQVMHDEIIAEFTATVDENTYDEAVKQRDEADYTILWQSYNMAVATINLQNGVAQCATGKVSRQYTLNEIAEVLSSVPAWANRGVDKTTLSRNSKLAKTLTWNQLKKAIKDAKLKPSVRSALKVLGAPAGSGKSTQSFSIGKIKSAVDAGVITQAQFDALAKFLAK